MKRILALTALVAIVATAFYGVASARHGTLVARLSGTEEVEGGDTDGTGNARTRLRPDQDRICYRLTWRNIGPPTAAHIHRGERGVNGDIVVTFFSAESPLPAEFTGVNGCASDVSDDLSNEIRNNPKDFYVNVHNEEFPGGAIRGQLRHPRR